MQREGGESGIQSHINICTRIQNHNYDGLDSQPRSKMGFFVCLFFFYGDGVKTACAYMGVDERR